MTQKRPVKHHEREPRNNIRGSQNKRRKPPQRKRRRRINWKRFLPTIILAVVFLYASVNLVRYAIRSVSTKQTTRELQAVYEQAAETPVFESPAAEPAPSPTTVPVPIVTQKPGLQTSYQYIGDSVLSEAEELLSKNPDMVAWLRIPGVVSLPVVYRDNTYYLDHDFYGKKNNGGTLFLDEAHPLLHDTQYMVIHGHNMHDGSMFGLLSHYLRREHLKEHPKVHFNTIYRQEKYEVIGVLFLPTDVQKEGFVSYIGTRKFRTADQFQSFADDIRKNALHWKEGAEMLPTDAFLALSTCYEDSRIVVMCRRTSP